MNEFVDLGTLAIQSINLFIVFVILYKFVWKPAMAYLDKEIIARRELESLHQDMQAMRDNVALELSSVLEQARHDAKQIRSQSELLATQEREAILAIAQVEADRIKEQALQDSLRSQASMEQEMKSKIVQVALALNQKIFGATSDAHKDLIVSNIPNNK